MLNGKTSSLKMHLGFAAFTLAILSLVFIRKKIVAYLAALSVFLMILANGGFLAEFFFKYVPEFSKTRHIARVLFVVAFSASVLVGYGFAFICNQLTKKSRIGNLAKKSLFILLCVIILSELFTPNTS